MRLRRRVKPGGSAVPIREKPGDKRPLSEADLAGFYAATEQRTSGTTPSVYDLEMILQELERFAPIEVHTTRRQLRWLLNKGAPQYLGETWEHPWQR